MFERIRRLLKQERESANIPAKKRHSKLCTTLCISLIHEVCYLNLSKPVAAEVKRGPGRICCFIHKQWLLFLLPSPQLMFCCPSWSLMCFAVSSIFLFECVLIFFILKSLLTKGASPFNSCWETSAQWIQTARQCRRPDETSFGQASTTCPWPLQLGCLEHIMDDADFWNGSLVLWM